MGSGEPVFAVPVPPTFTNHNARALSVERAQEIVSSTQSQVAKGKFEGIPVYTRPVMAANFSMLVLGPDEVRALKSGGNFVILSVKKPNGYSDRLVVSAETDFRTHAKAADYIRDQIAELKSEGYRVQAITISKPYDCITLLNDALEAGDVRKANHNSGHDLNNALSAGLASVLPLTAYREPNSSTYDMLPINQFFDNAGPADVMVYLRQIPLSGKALAAEIKRYEEETGDLVVKVGNAYYKVHHVSMYIGTGHGSHMVAQVHIQTGVLASEPISYGFENFDAIAIISYDFFEQHAPAVVSRLPKKPPVKLPLSDVPTATVPSRPAAKPSAEFLEMKAAVASMLKQVQAKIQLAKDEGRIVGIASAEQFLEKAKTAKNTDKAKRFAELASEYAEKATAD